jgi:hypothetical protein
LLAALMLSFLGCASENYGKLSRTNQITGKELRQNWADYTVYYQPYYALLYKINNDRKIVLSSRWIEVPDEDMLKNSTAFYLNEVKEILGQNDELYGYLIYPSLDNAYVKLIDEKTVEVIYSRKIIRGE